MFNSSSFKYLFNFPFYVYCIGICSTRLFVCMYVKTNLLQVLVIVNIEAIRVVKDVSDVQPSQKGHLHRHLKAKLLKGVSFFTGVPNRDKGEGLEECHKLSSCARQTGGSLDHLPPMLLVLVHSHARQHPEAQRPVQRLKVMTF